MNACFDTVVLCEKLTLGIFFASFEAFCLLHWVAAGVVHSNDSRLEVNVQEQELFGNELVTARMIVIVAQNM